MAAPLGRRAILGLRFCPSLKRRLSSSARLSTSGTTESHESSRTSEKVKENERSETHFGFQSVPEDEKEHKVYEVFENVASKYDMMNDAMSAGVHRVWKDIFLERFSPAPGTKLLDVAGGTGDIAFRFLKYVGTPTYLSTHLDIEIPRDITAKVYLDSENVSSSSDDETSQSSESELFISSSLPDPNGSHVTVCDINQPMLEVGVEKAQQLGYTAGMSWLKGNAEALPLLDNKFDAYTIAFGIRNCTHVQQVLNEAYRVLKPGGRFMCLEFSEVKNPLLRSIYDTYSFQVIPVMGHVIAGDWKSYQYLVESIRQFPNQEDFAAMIKVAGFRMVSYENLTFGVAAIHSGFKI